MKKIAIIGCACLLFFGFYVGKRYYSWATNANNAQTPFDEVGIGLHKYMPRPVQVWGCERLRQTFGNKTMPPHGCGDPNARGQWSMEGAARP